MVIHYDNQAKAIEHLSTNGWKKTKSERWVSKDNTCRASIHPVATSEFVAVFYEEIPRRAWVA